MRSSPASIIARIVALNDVTDLATVVSVLREAAK
jgi:hypothetical protein